MAYDGTLNIRAYFFLNKPKNACKTYYFSLSHRTRDSQSGCIVRTKTKDEYAWELTIKGIYRTSSANMKTFLVPAFNYTHLLTVYLTITSGSIIKIIIFISRNVSLVHSPHSHNHWSFCFFFFPLSLCMRWVGVSQIIVCNSIEQS